MRKSILTIVVALLTCILITSCGMSKEEYEESLEKYPNSGEIEFGDITLTIPDGYIRDTTMKGTEEGVARRWEQGNYKKIVTISIHEQYDINEETLAQIKSNQEGFSTGDVSAQLVEFNGAKAIESHIPVEDDEMVYLIFNAEGLTYEFSVQGDTSEYEAIRDSIKY